MNSFSPFLLVEIGLGLGLGQDIDTWVIRPFFCFNFFVVETRGRGATMILVGGILFRVIVCLSLEWYRIFALGAL